MAGKIRRDPAIVRSAASVRQFLGENAALPEPVQIRRAAPEDAPAIAAVLYESFVEFRPLYTDQGFRATTPDAAGILGRMKEGPVWIAVREHAAIGTAAAVCQDGSLYIRGMAVVPSARGAGIGEKLMGEIERFATSSGCGRVFLSTTPFLTSAIELYRKLGFSRAPDRDHDLFGTPLFTMEKTSSAPS